MKEGNDLDQYYHNDQPILAVRKNTAQLALIAEQQTYDKYNNNIIKREESKISNILSCIAKLIRNFDVFGAKPNLNASPHGSSVIGCLLSSSILILSILTFALTIANMEKSQFIVDYDYTEPDQTHYTILTGGDLRLAFCSSNIDKLVGYSRSAQVNFYKYDKVNGKTIIPAVKMNAAEQGYFDIPIG